MLACRMQRSMPDQKRGALQAMPLTICFQHAHPRKFGREVHARMGAEMGQEIKKRVESLSSRMNDEMQAD